MVTQACNPNTLEEELKDPKSQASLGYMRFLFKQKPLCFFLYTKSLTLCGVRVMYMSRLWPHRWLGTKGLEKQDGLPTPSLQL